MPMTPRERVLATLAHETPDRVAIVSAITGRSLPDHR